MTRSGVRIRSKIEKIIADFLHAEGVRFVYEPTAFVGGVKTRLDFYLPDENLYYEHIGGTDDNYQHRANAKIALYQQNGVKLIYSTAEDEPDIEDVIVDLLATIALAS